MNKYKLSQYNSGAWCILELKTTPEMNERTGKLNKNPGEAWVPIKYPGNLAAASRRLLSLVIGTEDELDARELLKAVRRSEATIVANIAQFVEVWK